KKRSCCYSFKCFRCLEAFFSKIVSQAMGSTNSARANRWSTKSFIGLLEVVNHISNERELIMPGPVIVRAIIVGMVESELGANSDEFILPPSNADGMFGILCGKPGPGTHLLVKVFIPHREERARCNPEHRVIHNRPLRRITI